MQVVLFKSPTEDSQLPDKFKTILASSSEIKVDPQIVPVLSFNFCNNDKLAEKLHSHEEYEGIIFSSPRCVQSIQQGLSITSAEAPLLKAIWESKYLFCSGNSTAELVKNMLPRALKIYTAPEENAESLGHQIVQVFQPQQSKCRLLYPCGNLKRDTLQNIVSYSENVTADAIIVYETIENPELMNVVSKLNVQPNSPFVFFSPSGLEFTFPYIKDLILMKSRPLIALGPTTKDALLKISDINVNNIFQCDKPSPEGLIKCLKLIFANLTDPVDLL